MKIITTLALAGVLTLFGACSEEQSAAPEGPTNTAPAGEMTEVSLELPGMT